MPRPPGKRSLHWMPIRYWPALHRNRCSKNRWKPIGQETARCRWRRRTRGPGFGRSDNNLHHPSPGCLWKWQTDEKVVRMEMPFASSKIMRALLSPALPTTNPSRKKRMIPRMVRTLGVNTPAKVPSVPCFLSEVFFIWLFCVIVIPTLFLMPNILKYRDQGSYPVISKYLKLTQSTDHSFTPLRVPFVARL